MWVAWNSLEATYDFRKKPEKELSIDCLFFAEAPSKEAAVKTAHNSLGSYIKQIESEWAAEVYKVLDNKSRVDTNDVDADDTDEQLVVTDKLQECLNHLHLLTGLSTVKSTVQELVNIAKVAQMQAQAGIKAPTITRHLVFTGNPGTGKTTVARILGEIYNNLGVLSKGHFTEVDRTNLVADIWDKQHPKRRKSSNQL